MSLPSSRGPSGRATKPPLKTGLDADGANARVQRKAVARLSECELATGHTLEWWAEHHRVQRERVLARWAA